MTSLTAASDENIDVLHDSSAWLRPADRCPQVALVRIYIYIHKKTTKKPKTMQVFSRGTKTRESCCCWNLRLWEFCSAAAFSPLHPSIPPSLPSSLLLFVSLGSYLLFKPPVQRLNEAPENCAVSATGGGRSLSISPSCVGKSPTSLSLTLSLSLARCTPAALPSPSNLWLHQQLLETFFIKYLI